MEPRNYTCSKIQPSNSPKQRSRRFVYYMIRVTYYIWYTIFKLKIIKNFSLLRFILGCSLLTIGAYFYLISFFFLDLNEALIEWEVISINSTNIHLVFIIDNMSIFFIFLVMLISGRVMIFSTRYMMSEKFFSRFTLLVFFFILSIFLLILRPNFISLLLGWDGLGVTSYLLVVFYQSRKSYNAGMLTAITNRLGDVGLLISISFLLYMGNWNYIFMESFSNIFSNLLVFTIIISACTKRAQIPFSAWLPAAMAAPTPVSALVHSSTLVTAGVYLLIRINLIIIEINMSYLLLLMGMITMVIAGMTAMIEIDMKKIIALSTLSQLGVMILILGLGNPMLSFFHLLSHAFFKAMLFMCAGIVIHNIKDYQDIRKIGMGHRGINLCVSIMLVANIRLCGLPFLRGFYSKDLIIEILLIKGKNLFLFIFIIFGTILTVLYSCRLRFLVRLNFLKSESLFFISENSTFIVLGILILLPFSIAGGIVILWNIINIRKLIFLPFWIKLLVPTIIVFSVLLFYFIFNNINKYYRRVYIWFFSNMWFLPISFNIRLTLLNLNISNYFYKFVEARWSETLIFNYLNRLIGEGPLRKFFDYLNYLYIMQVIEIFILVFLCLIFISR